MAHRQKELTKREIAALAAIKAHIKEHNMPPTNAELMAALKLKSTMFVRRLLDRLTEKGEIEREKGISRGIRVVRRAPKNKSKII